MSNSSEGSWLWEQAQKDVVEFSRFGKGPKVRILPSGAQIGVVEGVGRGRSQAKYFVGNKTLVCAVSKWGLWEGNNIELPPFSVRV